MRFLTFIAYSACIVLSCFLLSCQAEQIEISEILRKSEEAISEIKSIKYETEVTQTIDNPLFEDITYKNVTTGKHTRDPIAYEIILKSTVADQEIEIKHYYVDDTLYYYKPVSGWAWEEYDIDNDDSINAEQIDLYESINVLLEIGVDDISVEENEGQYLITYSGDNKEVAKYYRKDFLEYLNSITKDLDTVLAMAGSIDYSDFDYTLSIDKETFLPETYSVSYTSKFKLLDENMYVYYDNVTRYLQYNSLEEIIVPDDVLEIAVHISDIND